MKIIPYLRFVWATFIIINFISRTNSNLDAINVIEIFLIALSGLISLTFSCFCVLIGLQEIKEKQIIDARFFEFFGLFFELLVFLGGLHLINVLFKHSAEYWRIGLMIIWQIGLLVFIFVDFKRMRTS
jgi:hypothetical protein